MNNGSQFVLDTDTKAVEFRYVTKAYNTEMKKRGKALIGMTVLQALGSIGEMGSATNIGISTGIMGYDLYDISQQTNEEKRQSGSSNASTVLLDTTSVFTGAIYGAAKKAEAINETGMKVLKGASDYVVVVGFMNNLTDLFYTSEEDWIETIEITVFAREMALIIRQSLTQQAEQAEDFNGIRMVKVKSKVDYCADSLKPINWNELAGTEVKIAEHVGEKEQTNVVTDEEQLSQVVNHNIGGEVTE